jgi:hypothetical protein
LRKVSALPLVVDSGNELRKRDVLDRSNLAEGAPKRIFETHARVATGDFDGSFDYWRRRSSIFAGHEFPRSPFMIRVAVGACGFFTLIQSGERPEAILPIP